MFWKLKHCTGLPSWDVGFPVHCKSHRRINRFTQQNIEFLYIKKKGSRTLQEKKRLSCCKLCTEAEKCHPILFSYVHKVYRNINAIQTLAPSYQPSSPSLLTLPVSVNPGVTFRQIDWCRECTNSWSINSRLVHTKASTDTTGQLATPVMMQCLTSENLSTKTLGSLDSCCVLLATFLIWL